MIRNHLFPSLVDESCYFANRNRVFCSFYLESKGALTDIRMNTVIFSLFQTRAMSFFEDV